MKSVRSFEFRVLGSKQKDLKYELRITCLRVTQPAKALCGGQALRRKLANE
jgi:hypothetical protein